MWLLNYLLLKHHSMYTHTHIYTHTYTHTHTHIIYTHIHTHTHIYTHTYTHTHTHIYTHIHTHTHTHIHTVGCSGQIGIMFLAEVALGKEHLIARDDPSLISAPKGFDCVVAKGRMEPGEKSCPFD